MKFIVGATHTSHNYSATNLPWSMEQVSTQVVSAMNEEDAFRRSLYYGADGATLLGAINMSSHEIPFVKSAADKDADFLVCAYALSSERLNLWANSHAQAFRLMLMLSKVEVCDRNFYDAIKIKRYCPEESLP